MVGIAAEAAAIRTQLGFSGTGFGALVPSDDMVLVEIEKEGSKLDRLANNRPDVALASIQAVVDSNFSLIRDIIARREAPRPSAKVVCESPPSPPRPGLKPSCRRPEICSGQQEQLSFAEQYNREAVGKMTVAGELPVDLEEGRVLAEFMALRFVEEFLRKTLRG